jgi:hypothetical protein
LKRHPRWLTGVLAPFHRLFYSRSFPRLAEETAKRVLILPLTIHSEKDLTFLNQGIMDMMASRIGACGHRDPQGCPGAGERPGPDGT